MRVQRTLPMVVLLLPACSQWPSLSPGGARTASCMDSESSDLRWEDGGTSTLAPSGFIAVSGPCTVSVNRRCFYSPGYPNRYPNNARCHLQTLTHLTLHVVRFDTEPGFDFLEVHGRRFNGTHGPHLQEVPGSADIQFYSDAVAYQAGFEICAEIFHVASGSCTTLVAGSCFASPNYHVSNYPNNVRCEVVVRTDTYLQVVDFHTELGFDLLTLNGALAFSGSRSPQGRLVRRGDNISFVSDGTVSRRGFLVCGSSVPTALPDSDGGSDSTSDSDYAAFVKDAASDSTTEHPGEDIPPLAPVFSIVSGECNVSDDGRCFTSPDYPSLYPNNARCSIGVARDVTLHVVSFTTESGYDILEVGGDQFDGTAGPHSRQAFSGSAIHFSSDATVTEAGFVVCAAHFLVVSGECKTTIGGACFDSPNFPSKYPYNSSCSINVTMESYVDAVSFSTHSNQDLFELEGGRVFSGSVGPDGAFVAQGSRILYASDSAGARGGFRVCDARAGAAHIELIDSDSDHGPNSEEDAEEAQHWLDNPSDDIEYEPVAAPEPPPAGGDVFQLVFGVCALRTNGRCIQSPGFPENYPSNSRCQIHVERDTFLEVLSFSTEEVWDELTLVNASGMYGFSGEVGPEGHFLQAGDSILFASDASTSSGGFEICGLDEHSTSPENQEVDGEGWLDSDSPGEVLGESAREPDHSGELASSSDSESAKSADTAVTSEDYDWPQSDGATDTDSATSQEGAAPALVEPLFQLVSGHCALSEGGTCVSTANSSALPANHTCVIRTAAGVSLNLERSVGHVVITTESDFDVGGVFLRLQLTQALPDDGARVCATGFSVLTGACMTSSRGACLESPEYPRSYPRNTSCTFRVLQEGYLDVVEFATTNPRDVFLFDDGAAFSGTSGPQDEFVRTNSIITFAAHSAGSGGMFKVCHRSALLATGLFDDEDGVDNRDSASTDSKVAESDRYAGDFLEWEVGQHYGSDTDTDSDSTADASPAMESGRLQPPSKVLEGSGQEGQSDSDSDLYSDWWGLESDTADEETLHNRGLDPSPVFEVTAGTCTTSRNSQCLQSPNYPSSYPNHLQCSVLVHAAIELHFKSAQADPWGVVDVGGRLLNRTLGPSMQSVAAGTVIRLLSSDENIAYRGFEVCATGFAILSGACELIHSGSCFRPSSGSSSDLLGNSSCVVRVLNDTYLQAVAFTANPLRYKLLLNNSEVLTDKMGVNARFVKTDSVLLFEWVEAEIETDVQICSNLSGDDSQSDNEEIAQSDSSLSPTWLDNTLRSHSDSDSENAPTMSEVFFVTSGDCTTVAGGTCFFSPGFHGEVQNSTHCNITVVTEVLLTPIEFMMQQGLVVLDANGEEIDRNVDPHSHKVPANSSIHLLSSAPGSGGVGTSLICAAAFTILSGTCTTSADSSCFASPNYPSMYPNNARCRIRNWLNTSLDVVEFDTETSLDKLILANGDEFSGANSGPQGQYVEAGSVMSFESDGSDTRRGFQICASVRRQSEIDATIGASQGTGVDDGSDTTDALNIESEAIGNDDVSSSNSSVVFNVVQGECTVSDTGYCFSSPNYPLEYPVNAQCSIIVGAVVTLEVIDFQTELTHDYLEVNGRKFNGTIGPNTEVVSQGTILDFVSDPVITASGFKICAVTFTWISGNCHTSTGGTCFESLAYPTQFNGSTHCRVKVELDTFLDLWDMDTDIARSKLSVDDADGTVELDPIGSIFVRAGSVLSFGEESNSTNQGFRVCSRQTARQTKVQIESDWNGSMDSDVGSGLDPAFIGDDSDTEDFLYSDSSQEDMANLQDSEQPRYPEEAAEAAIPPESGGDDDDDVLGWDQDAASDTATDAGAGAGYPPDADDGPEPPSMPPTSPNCAPTSSQAPAGSIGTSSLTGTPIASNISAPCTAHNLTSPAPLPTAAPLNVVVTAPPTVAPTASHTAAPSLSPPPTQPSRTSAPSSAITPWPTQTPTSQSTPSPSSDAPTVSPTGTIISSPAASFTFAPTRSPTTQLHAPPAESVWPTRAPTQSLVALPTESAQTSSLPTSLSMSPTAPLSDSSSGDIAQGPHNDLVPTVSPSPAPTRSPLFTQVTLSPTASTVDPNDLFHTVIVSAAIFETLSIEQFEDNDFDNNFRRWFRTALAQAAAVATDSARIREIASRGKLQPSVRALRQTSFDTAGVSVTFEVMFFRVMSGPANVSSSADATAAAMLFVHKLRSKPELVFSQVNEYGTVTLSGNFSMQLMTFEEYTRNESGTFNPTTSASQTPASYPTTVPPTEHAGVPDFEEPARAVAASGSSVPAPDAPPRSQHKANADGSAVLIGGCVAAAMVLVIGIAIFLAHWFPNRRTNTNCDGHFDQLLTPFDPTTAPLPLRQARCTSLLALGNGNTQRNPLYVQAESSSPSLCSTVNNEDVVNDNEMQFMQAENGRTDTCPSLSNDLSHNPSTELDINHLAQDPPTSAATELVDQPFNNHRTSCSTMPDEDFRITEDAQTSNAVIVQRNADALHVHLTAPDMTRIEHEDHVISAAANDVSIAHTEHARYDTYNNPDAEVFASTTSERTQSQSFLHNSSQSSTSMRVQQDGWQNTPLCEEHLDVAEDEFDDIL